MVFILIPILMLKLITTLEAVPRPPLTLAVVIPTLLQSPDQIFPGSWCYSEERTLPLQLMSWASLRWTMQQDLPQESFSRVQKESRRNPESPGQA